MIVLDMRVKPLDGLATFSKYLINLEPAVTLQQTIQNRIEEGPLVEDTLDLIEVLVGRPPVDLLALGR